MNIAYILPEFVTESECGGLGVYFDNISRLLANKGHRITVIVRAEADERINYHPNIVVHRVWTDLSKVNPNLQGSFYREWSRNLNRKLQRLHDEGANFDIAQYSNFTALALSRTSIPTIIRLSSDLPLLRATDRLEFDIHGDYECIKVTDYLEDISLMRADGVYSPSTLLAERIGKRTGKKIEVIESPYYPNIMNKEQKCDVGICSNNEMNFPYILTFGTLKLLKGIRVIGHCIYEVLNNNRKICWVFAGAQVPWKNDDGKDVNPMEYLKSSAGEHADRVIYMGKLGGERLRDLIQNAILCVMPSRIDNLPNACIEAMALGKVVIGTRGASFEQLIVDGENGFLIERENPVQLAKTVNAALRLNPAEIERMGSLAAVRIEAMSPEMIAEQLLSFYEKTRRKVARGETDGDSTYYKEMIGKYNQEMYSSGIEDIGSYLL